MFMGRCEALKALRFAGPRVQHLGVWGWALLYV